MIPTLVALHRQFPLLLWSTFYTAILLVLSLALLAFDQRLVTGANPWLKPIKFEVSIVIFNLTVAWMLLQLSSKQVGSQVIAPIIAAVIGVAMCVEISAITAQAARGITSHYNRSTPLNATVFNAMAAAILINTLAVVALLLLYCQPQPQIPAPLLWGIRLGLILFLFSSLQGLQMVANSGHTVGARDGGPGLPVLRWSTRFGDLRVAHFIGLHGLQILPLLGYALSRIDRLATPASVAIVATTFALLASLFFTALNQASSGRPLLR